MMCLKKLSYEKTYLRKGFELVIGVDEAGRGPLAGPVVAGAAAIINFGKPGDELRKLLLRVNDSKLLSQKKREDLFQAMMNCPDMVCGLASVSHEVIDKINILQATKLAMAGAIGDLLNKAGPQKGEPVFCLIDGNFKIETVFEQRPIIKGDRKVFSIAAASIIAKVTRDRLMASFDEIYPGYGFIKHKGYPTSYHYEAIASLGLCPIHRKTFGPCRQDALGTVKKN